MAQDQIMAAQNFNFKTHEDFKWNLMLVFPHAIFNTSQKRVDRSGGFLATGVQSSFYRGWWLWKG